MVKEKHLFMQGMEVKELQSLIKKTVENLLKDFKKELGQPKTVDELLTPKETCSLLKIDSSTLWRWVRDGIIPQYGIKHQRYYKKNEVLNCLVPLNNPRTVNYEPFKNAA
ncbi:helix-turn-helix domain-containing protein [Galbibacter sp. PAP.153]|uniref:helix-turn-helix domain-containing protein n=1 Tax=Galbibacter sp. PAP.153 TaxID=3104623 RepID=UPI00300BDDCA